MQNHEELWFGRVIVIMYQNLFIEYLIPVGTPAPDGSCHFTYRSMSRKFGRFNSPRHPANYPSSTNCTYIFLATANEQVSYLKKTTSMHNIIYILLCVYLTSDYNLILQVQIVFDNFKVRTDMLQPDNLKVNNITDKSSAWKAYGLVFDFILITNTLYI